MLECLIGGLVGSAVGTAVYLAERAWGRLNDRIDESICALERWLTEVQEELNDLREEAPAPLADGMDAGDDTDERLGVLEADVLRLTVAQGQQSDALKNLSDWRDQHDCTHARIGERVDQFNTDSAAWQEKVETIWRDRLEQAEQCLASVTQDVVALETGHESQRTSIRTLQERCRDLSRRLSKQAALVAVQEREIHSAEAGLRDLHAKSGDKGNGNGRKAKTPK